MPNGIPRYVRVYDNDGKTFDRYTVVFTGKYRRNRDEDFVHLGMNAEPFAPQGFGQHGFSNTMIDKPTYAHLGRKIDFKDLPEKCQEAVRTTYKHIWRIDGV